MRTLLIVVALVSLPALLKAQIVINEICASNGDLVFERDFYDFPSWVELYNAGNTSVDISNFSLSDDPMVTNKWQIPSGTTIQAKAFVIIYCDDRNYRMHTNFNLDADGEVVILSNKSGTEISS
jgi:hypothetical protein